MNATIEIAPVITAANEALKRDFPLKPFAIRHKLAGRFSQGYRRADQR